MNKARHTPGPWIVEGEFFIGAGDIRDDFKCVAHLADSDELISPLEQQANLRLILAAPDLLAACQQLLREPFGCVFCDSGTLRNPLKSHERDCPFLLAQNALAKAKGEA